MGPNPFSFLHQTVDRSSSGFDRDHRRFNSGWGYHTQETQNNGHWLPYQQDWHINCKELEVPWLFLRHNPQLSQLSIRFRMDNKAGSSRSSHLLSLTEDIFHLANKRQLQFTATYLLGVDDSRANALSREPVPSAEWNPLAFKSLQDRFCPPLIDLFTSATNTKRTISFSSGSDTCGRTRRIHSIMEHVEQHLPFPFSHCDNSPQSLPQAVPVHWPNTTYSTLLAGSTLGPKAVP